MMLPGDVERLMWGVQGGENQGFVLLISPAAYAELTRDSVALADNVVVRVTRRHQENLPSDSRGWVDMKRAPRRYRG